MSQPRKPFVSIIPEVDDDVIEAIAVRKGIPSLQPTTSRTAVGAGGKPDSPAGGLSAAGKATPTDGAGQGAETPQLSRDPVQAPKVLPETSTAMVHVRPRKHSTKVSIPDYAMRELKLRSARDDVTVNHLLLKALDQSGIPIKPEDMMKDGRRMNGKSLKTTG